MQFFVNLPYTTIFEIVLYGIYNNVYDIDPLSSHNVFVTILWPIVHLSNMRKIVQTPSGVILFMIKTYIFCQGKMEYDSNVLYILYGFWIIGSIRLYICMSIKSISYQCEKLSRPTKHTLWRHFKSHLIWYYDTIHRYTWTYELLNHNNILLCKTNICVEKIYWLFFFVYSVNWWAQTICKWFTWKYALLNKIEKYSHDIHIHTYCFPLESTTSMID